MQKTFRRSVVAAVAIATASVGFSGSSKASEATLSATTGEQQYHLRLHHLHTGEDIDVVYRIGDAYIPAALDKLNYFLRDHRTQTESNYDPKEFDLLHALMARLGRPDGVIDIVCGYRTQWSNAFLRQGRVSSGVAEHSQHMLAKAIDIRVPGVPTTTLRDTALELHGGGVGYYPINQFVHVDVGPVRQWSYGVATAHVARAAHKPHSKEVSAGE
ncbi:MAG TPA: DUF882 domain-containing protein [Edaphobacter sp.]|nr:DUF882 domain-containing protein [Edaphobacter sp.]